MFPKQKWSHASCSIIVATLLILGLGSCSGGGGGAGSAEDPNAFIVSGTLTVGQGLVLDGDTNDPNNPTSSNDTVPQNVSIPVSIGGYADESNDSVDIYKVNLEQTTTIVLGVGQPDSGDLDLFFEEEDGTVISSSTGSGSYEIIEADPDTPGDFHIRVQAHSGASNYVLTMGLSISSSAALTPLLHDDLGLMSRAEFVADEIILQPKADPGSQRALATASSMADYFGLVQESASGAGPLLMKLGDVANSPFMLQRAAQRGLSVSNQPLDEKETKARTLEMIKLLRSHPEIEYAEPNYIYHITAVPDDESYKFQWHYPIIDLPQAWDITTGDDSVVVAVVDTGILSDHPDLSSRILKESGNIVGYDFIRESGDVTGGSRDGDGIDPDPFDEGDLARGNSSTFHGSHVAGTIAAASDNSDGVAGVTWQGKIMPMRALGKGGSGNAYDIAQCIRYAAQLTNDSGTVPTVKADVINLSLGPNNEDCEALPAVSATYGNAVRDAMNAGVVVVVAAGNDNCDVPAPLSLISGVINVSAVDAASQKAPYSNYGTTIDVAAPGGDTSADLNSDGRQDGVISTVADDSAATWVYGVADMQGTSMAAPHLAGVVALMLAANPTLTPTDINDLIAGTHTDANAGPITQDLGDTGKDTHYGYGLINAYQAVNVANSITGGGGNTIPDNTPVLSVFPNPLQFSTGTDSLELSLENIGTASLDVTAISEDATWLSLSTISLPLTIGTDDAATKVTVSVDRSGLAGGTHLSTINITSTGGSVSLPVSLQVQSSAGGDVGEVYVLVVDPDTYYTVSQAITRLSSNYAFRTARNVPQGRYFVAAGTDRNNDGSICEAGEACGLYPLIDSPTQFDLNGDLSGVDFIVSYDFFTSQAAARVADALGLATFGGFQRLDFERVKKMDVNMGEGK